jgi:thiamine-phosphate pyrophosphorylase
MTLFSLGMELARVAAETGGLLFVNDRVDVALACGADGAHLGTRSLSPGDARRVLGGSVPSPVGLPWIGASVHSPGECEVAVAYGADFLFAGSVFPTPSHPGGRPLGPEGFAEVRRSAGDRAVFGIGGITPDRVGEVLSAGGRGVAVLSGVWEAADPAEAVHAYLSALRQPGADRDPSG